MAPRKPSTVKSKQSRLSDTFKSSKPKSHAKKLNDVKKLGSVKQEAVKHVVTEIKPQKNEINEAPELDTENKTYRKALKELQSKDIASPVHQEDLNTAEKLVKKFDLSMEFGPIVGISRLDRWKRAEKLGLNPPLVIKDILETKQGLTEPKYSESFIADYL